MIFGKLFGRKNNDNYNEDLLNQKRKEAQEEIEAYKEKINKKTNGKIDEIIEKNSKSLLKDIEIELVAFKQKKEKIIKTFSEDEKMLNKRLERNKRSSIYMLNSFIDNYKENKKNIESKYYKDVLEAYENAIKEIENS